jgi:hypothetical protein
MTTYAAPHGVKTQLALCGSIGMGESGVNVRLLSQLTKSAAATQRLAKRSN